MALRYSFLTLALLVLHVLRLQQILLVTGTLVMEQDSQTPPPAHSKELEPSTPQLEAEDYPCGDGYCRCDNTTADCAWHRGRLTYVPELPDVIRNLDFQGNGVTSIEHDDFFRNVTNVTFLLLSANGLTNINPGALRPLKFLQNLVLNQNRHLTRRALTAAFSIPTLLKLSLSDSNLGPLPEGLVPEHPTPQLETLNLDGNRISPMNITILSRLVNLKLLDVSMNNIAYGFISDYLPRLEHLIMPWTGLYTFPETCRNGTSLFPNLVELSLNHNVLGTLPKQICLPSLQTLSLSDNLLLEIEPWLFNQRSFPVLRILELESIPTLRSIDRHAFSNPSLEQLFLTYNRLDLGLNAVVDSDSLAGCDNLWFLKLSYNRWNDMSDARFHRLFGNLTSLSWLELENTGLSRITSQTFKDLRSLEKINLQNNKLSDLPDGAFDGLVNMSSILMTKNKISIVGPDAFGEDTRERLRELDISNNPFSCSCDLLWFCQWLNTDPSLFKLSWGHYACANVPGTTVQSFHMAEQACLLSRDASIFTIITIVLLLTVMTSASSLYRYRWHIRLVLYEAFRGQGERWRRLQEEHFQYDIFVSFDSEDLDWVRFYLMPELEDRMGLRLCIHQRDFIPGQNIVDNISHSVEASKKVLMLFSKSFCESQWCQFELNLCLRHVMDYDDTLVVVLLHDIPSRDLTPAMMAVMKTMTYIEWDESPEAVASFWGRIRLALQEIIPGV